MTDSREPPGRYARRLAQVALRRIDTEGAYANLVLPALLESSGLTTQGRGLVTDVVYGVCRQRRRLDARIDAWLLRPVTDDVRRLLRAGAYELVETEVAHHAAVSENVQLAPPKVRGLVNAVLRRIAESATTEPAWRSEAERLSVPDWIVERLTADLGEADATAALERMNERPVPHRRDDGYVQDLASEWVAAAVPCPPGEMVLDLCAAPGGKATAMAGRGAAVVAADRRASRVGLVVANAATVGVSLTGVVVGDGTAPPFRDAAFDHVLVDAPCSGLGVLRRRPDARWRIEEADIDALAALQRRLLSAAAPRVRPGGTLTYSVCTVTAAETIDQDEWLASPDGPTTGWEAVEVGEPWRPAGRGGRLLPHHEDTDGMYLLVLRRPA